ncbi:prepilin-type N-terminal cleavage/methylation domain-containing protein [Planomicrobium okeanokoites]|nr:prepilin-type N-terminal cleavage/methylation domain-containing protein [Planomicrobium okeanokoites]TAA71619.1 prepilin-type N-terminal cleavage/methylation domain-containing protein [Planomicrobium okeanokoites]
MKKFLKKKLGNEKGMTLIELLAVIVILAIIAAIAIPAIGNIIENSRIGAAKSDALNAMAAAELFLADNPSETVVDDITDLNGYLDDKGTLTAFSYKPAVGATAAAMAGTAAVTDTISMAFGADPAVPSVTKAQVSDFPNKTASGTTVGGITITGR